MDLQPEGVDNTVYNAACESNSLLPNSESHSISSELLANQNDASNHLNLTSDQIQSGQMNLSAFDNVPNTSSSSFSSINEPGISGNLLAPINIVSSSQTDPISNASSSTNDEQISQYNDPQPQNLLKVAEFARLNGPKKVCAACKNKIENKPHIFWQTMVFCLPKCITDYQSRFNVCAQCNKSNLPAPSSRIWVKSGDVLKQFCSNECQKSYKRTLTVCANCPSLIAQSEVFFARDEARYFKKHFCSEECHQEYKSNDVDSELILCTGCMLETHLSTKLERTNGRVDKLCSQGCLNDIKRRGNFKTAPCDCCKRSCEFTDMWQKYVVHGNGTSKAICGVPCFNRYIHLTGVPVSCASCKSAKMNFDMVEFKQRCGDLVYFCSLNCLTVPEKAQPPNKVQPNKMIIVGPNRNTPSSRITVQSKANNPSTVNSKRIMQESTNMQNKSTSVKPSSESKGVSFQPVSQSNFSQTDDIGPSVRTETAQQIQEIKENSLPGGNQDDVLCPTAAMETSVYSQEEDLDQRARNSGSLECSQTLQLTTKRKHQHDEGDEDHGAHKTRTIQRSNGLLNNGSDLADEPPDENNQSKFIFGVNAWKHWVTGKNNDAQGQLSNLFGTDILELSMNDLNDSLSLFVQEARKPNGEKYPPDNILYFAYDIQKYLFENGRMSNIFMNTLFEPFTDALHNVINGFQLPRTGQGEIITRIDEEHLWESRQLGAQSPRVLLNTLVYFNTKFFKLKTVDDHLKLASVRIIPKSRTMDPLTSGPSEDCTKIFVLQCDVSSENGLNGGPRSVELLQNTNDPLRCPVKLYEFYLSKCSDVLTTRDGVFYLQPDRPCVPDSPSWYTSVPLSDLHLEKMLQRVLLVKEIQECLTSVD